MGIFLLSVHVCTSVPTLDSDWVCRVRAAREICKGEEITDTYTATLTTTAARRASLKTGKYFDCSCKRCADPTEQGNKVQH